MEIKQAKMNDVWLYTEKQSDNLKIESKQTSK